MKRRWILVLVVVGWLVIGVMLGTGQWTQITVGFKGRGSMAWSSEGVAAHWEADRVRDRWRWKRLANNWQWRMYVVPEVHWTPPLYGLYVPWVWVVVGYARVMWVVWRWTRERKVVGAFEVGVNAER